MTLTQTEARVAARTPAGARVMIGVLLFLGITALVAGSAMVFGIGNEATMLPDEWLDSLPLIDSWVFPGIVLAAGFGLGSLLVAWGAIRRPDWAWARPVERSVKEHWAWIGTFLLGLGMVTWIALQFAFLPEYSWLMVLYGVIGLALLGLPFVPSVRRHYRRT
jgi:hypothetical protein